MNLQKQRILDRLKEEAKKGRFYSVTYDQYGQMKQSSSNAPPTAPKSCICNETGAEFGEDTRQGRRLALRRESWTFKMILTFATEVSCETFEADMMDKVIVVPPKDSLPSVQLRLMDAEYDHPPEQMPGNGSRVEYTFEAVEGRR